MAEEAFTPVIRATGGCCPQPASRCRPPMGRFWGASGSNLLPYVPPWSFPRAWQPRYPTPIAPQSQRYQTLYPRVMAPAPCLLVQPPVMGILALICNANPSCLVQQQILCVSVAPLPRATPNGGWCRALEPHVQDPWLTQDPMELFLKVPSLQVSSGGARAMPLCLMWDFRLVWTPKSQTQQYGTQPILLGEVHQGTRPLHALPALFSPGFWSKSQLTIFVMSPLPSQVPPQSAVPMGSGSPMGYCRKLPDGYRSPPRGSRVSAADHTEGATVGTCEEVGVLRRFFLADFRMTLLLTSFRVMAE